MSLVTLQGVAASVASISPLKYAAGIYIPNYHFRDWNTSLYYDTSFAGEDGNTWRQLGFRDWFTPQGGNGYGNAYGTAGMKVPKGYYDGAALWMTTSVTTGTAEDIENANQVLHTSVFSRQLPFYYYYNSHYYKPITLALTINPTSSGWTPTWGVDCRAYLACYNSAHEFCSEANGDWDSGVEPLATNPIEFEFDENGNTIADGWQQRLAHTGSSEAMCIATRYVQVYLGIKGNGSNSLGLELDMASLMINPTNADTVATVSPDYFVDLDDIYLESPPGMDYDALGVSECRMADGRLNRVAAAKGGFAAKAHLGWWSEDGETKQKLMMAWLLSTGGLGIHVPEAVPICVDAGVGQLPRLGYYHVMGSLGAPFTPDWSVGNQGYDMGFSIVEVL